MNRRRIKPNDMLLSNKLEDDFQSIFKPIYFTSKLFLSRKFVLRDNLITPITYKDTFVTCVGVFIQFYLLITTINVFGTQFSKNSPNYYVYCILFIHFTVSYSTLAFINIYCSKSNVKLILKLQEIDKVLPDDIDKKKIKILMWLATGVLFLMYFTMFILKSNYDPQWWWSKGTCILINLMFDLELLYMTLLALFLVVKIKTWRNLFETKIKARMTISEDGHTAIEIDNNMLTIFQLLIGTEKNMKDVLQSAVDVVVVMSHLYGVICWGIKYLGMESMICISYELFYQELSSVRVIIIKFLNHDCSICLPSFMYGMSIAWMSPMTLLLQSKESPKGIPLTDAEISWMAALPYLICVPGNYLIAYMGDTIGRKSTLLFLSAVCSILWILKLMSMNIWVFVLARSLVGITMAGNCVTTPIYIKEISEGSIRGALGCWRVLFCNSGGVFMYVIGDLLNYNVVLWVGLFFPVLHFVLFLGMPESPSFLVKTGKIEKAAKTLAWLRCRKEDDCLVQNELDIIRKEQFNDEENGKHLLKTIFTDKILFRAFQIALVAVVSREICGAVPVLNFAGDIFKTASEDTGLVMSPNQQTMVLGVVRLTGSILASSVIEKAGRRPLMFITTLVFGLSMCLLATWFIIKEYGIAAPAWIPVLTLCLCMFCDSFGLMPISVVITGEIFSFKYRGTVLAITMAIASFADFFQLLFFKPFANSIGVHVAFYCFGTMCLLTALYVLLALPETKAKGLDEIYKDLRPKKLKKLEKVKA